MGKKQVIFIVGKSSTSTLEASTRSSAKSLEGFTFSVLLSWVACVMLLRISFAKKCELSIILEVTIAFIRWFWDCSWLILHGNSRRFLS